MKILITGSSGFVGSSLLYSLRNSHHQLCVVSRKLTLSDHATTLINVENIDANTDWQNALIDVDTVIHLAARVHVMHENAKDPLAAFRAVNVEGTLNLANQASKAGVKRFIFVSSVKVNGESTDANHSFVFSDEPNPQDAYGTSKLEAEEGLISIAKATGLEIVIIRPPLVYGKDVKANFSNMLKLVNLGLPLPFGAINNKRSLIYVENLVSFITLCITHPDAANQTFLVSDGEDVSTTQLLQMCASAMGKHIWLLPIPQSWLTSVLNILGKQNLVQRLFGNLQIDNQYAYDRLNWRPPFTLAEGLQHSVSKKA